MAFWDDFQKTMSKTAESGIKQTNKWLEIGKLTMSLNAAKLELNDLFEQLGEYGYVQNHLVKPIRACENCGYELSESDKYCPQCRAPQSDKIDWHL